MNVVELIINNPPTAKLDMDQNFKIALQYSIADIRDISKRNSAYSKTIILPGTKNNNFWLGNLFDINADFTAFNPNRKTQCRLTVNSETVIDGFFQLKKINKLNNVDQEANKIQYEIVIYNNAVDLMTELGEKKINELNFDEFDHVFSLQSITQSWDNTYQDGYVYPMYGLQDTPNVYQADWFYPSMFYWTLLDRTLYEAGFGWTGSLKTNEQFQKEILAYVTDGRPQISEVERRRREFQAGLTPSNTQTTITMGSWNVSSSGSGQVLAPTHSPFNDDSSQPNFDNGPDNWNTTTYEWTCDVNGKFAANLQLSGLVALYNAGATATGHWDSQSLFASNLRRIQYKLDVKVYIAPVSGVPLIQTWGAGPAYTYTYTFKDYSFNNVLSSTFPSGATHSLGAFNIDLNCPVKEFSIGDKVWVQITVNRQATPNNQTAYWDQPLQSKVILNGSSNFRNIAMSGPVSQGDILGISSTLPDKVKQKDILKDLITRYNLYISIDPDNDRMLIMDPRPDYYDSGEILDWTLKKDYSSEDDIQLLSELQFKELIFSWKNDDDDYNKGYTTTTGDVYGQLEYTFDNDFVKGEKKFESPFSPTPIIWNGDYIGAHLPAINPVAPKIKPRVLYWGGLKDCIYNWDIKYKDIVTGLPATWVNSQIGGKYPYSGHFDDPIEPTLDINFGVCKYYFYNNYAYLTNNNQYNRYWSNYAEQIENGRLLTAKFYLSEYDIRYIKENFNSRIFIEGSYYYVNKIADYDPLNNGVTTVELIKILEGVTWDGSQPVGVGGNVGLTWSKPDINGPNWDDDGTAGPFDPTRPVRPIKDWGWANQIGVGGIVLKGDNNKGGGAQVNTRISTNWILRYGYWEDPGYWIDGESWIDSPTFSESTYSGRYSSPNIQFFYGDNNTLEGNKNYVYGDNNTIEADNASIIGGDNNYIEASASNVHLVGVSGLTVSSPNQIYLGPSFSVNTITGQFYVGGSTVSSVDGTGTASYLTKWSDADTIMASEVIESSGLLRTKNGNWITPAFSFNATQDIGMFRPSSTSLGLSVKGTASIFYLNQAAFKDGSYTAPGITFIDDLDTGLWRYASNTMGIAAGGATNSLYDQYSVQHYVKVSMIDSVFQFEGYTVANLPNPVTAGQGSMVFCYNETGGSTMVFSDGANWRRVQDRAIAS